MELGDHMYPVGLSADRSEVYLIDTPRPDDVCPSVITARSLSDKG